MFTVETKELAEWFGLELCRLAVDERLAKHELKIGLKSGLPNEADEENNSILRLSVATTSGKRPATCSPHPRDIERTVES
jgi:hypothetical protein